jgi:hypothetical protein
LCRFEPADYTKAEFKDAASGEIGWMWVKVSSADEANRLVFGSLDNEPLIGTDLHLGMELVISFDNIREHMKASSFNQ